MFYFVVTVQTAINTGVSIGAILLAADCLEVRRRCNQEISCSQICLLVLSCNVRISLPLYYL